jgi:hypothetical protein
MTGTITLIDIYGNISSAKRYQSKRTRNIIISTWIKTYNLKDKNFCFHILPDNPQDLITNGFVCITADTHYEKKFYNSIEHREKIIQEFASEKNLNKYCLEITPTKW